MLSEQDLQEAMAEAVEDPAAERFLIGLSDRALAEAREGSRWRWSAVTSGRRGKLVPGLAIGSAFAVAAAVGVAALGAGGSGSGGGPQSALGAPNGAEKPVGQAGLTGFMAECFGHQGPKLDLSYVWDPAAQKYHGVAGDLATSFYPSPDGKKALVQQGVAPGVLSWAVADWADAVAGHVTQHPVGPSGGVHWSADGREVVVEPGWSVVKATGELELSGTTVTFYNPDSGHLLATVPIPQKVLDRVKGGQWALQQVQGDHDSALFPMLSADGDRLEYLNAQGNTVRTVTLQDGLPAGGSGQSELTDTARLSPDGHYLAETADSVLVVFDLQAGGRRIGRLDVSGHSYTGWIGDHQIVTAVDGTQASPKSPASSPETPASSGPKGGGATPATGHSPLFSVLTPDLHVLQQATFVLPADPRGSCAIFPASFGPVGQFPGAFVP